MNVRLILVSALVASTALLSQPANAHDPKQFDRMMQDDAAQIVPTTCVELAARDEYPADADNAGIQALKTRCDAEKKAASKASRAVNKPAPSKTK